MAECGICLSELEDPVSIPCGQCFLPSCFSPIHPFFEQDTFIVNAASMTMSRLQTRVAQNPSVLLVETALCSVSRVDFIRDQRLMFFFPFAAKPDVRSFFGSNFNAPESSLSCPFFLKTTKNCFLHLLDASISQGRPIMASMRTSVEDSQAP